MLNHYTLAVIDLKSSLAVMPRVCERSAWKNAIGFALLLQFFFAVAMTASPSLHERLHHHAGQSDHVCIVTILHNGGSDGSALPLPIIAAPVQQTGTISSFSKNNETRPVFLLARIFEHAPPVA
jgi:hypothetical protein